MKYFYRAFVALFLLAGCNSRPNASNHASQLPEINTRLDTALHLKGDTIVTVSAGALAAEESSVATAYDNGVEHDCNLTDFNMDTISEVLNIKPETFDEIPAQIDGCSGLYTCASTPLEQKKYLFITNLQELAFIKINGRQIELKSLQPAEVGEQHRYTYRGEGYEVILYIKTVKRVGDELWQESGTLEILQGEKKVVVNIHGDSGC